MFCETIEFDYNIENPTKVLWKLVGLDTKLYLFQAIAFWEISKIFRVRNPEPQYIGGGVILADFIGLGKSVQVLANIV